MRYLTIDPSYPWKAAKRFWMRHCYLPWPKDTAELYRGPPVEHLKANSPYFKLKEEINKKLETPVARYEKHMSRRVWVWELNLIIDRR